MVSRISAASSGSERPAARLRLPLWLPGLARSSSREVIRADRPERCLRAARRALRSRAPVTGRARTCRTACSPSARPAAAPASARSGASGSWPADSGRMSGRARRSVPPAMAAPGGSGGPAGAVTVCAPGQAASTARSIRPGGRVPGTHRRIVIPAAVPPAQVYSQPRCGCPDSSRAHGGRSSPVRCPHSAAAPAGPACGGARTVTCRAASANAACCRRRSQARPAITAVTAAASSGPAAGP